MPYPFFSPPPNEAIALISPSKIGPKPDTKKSFDYNKESKALNGVPIWKLFIDKACHDGGEKFFDHSIHINSQAEPGYSQAMYSAFDYVLTNIDKKLDADEFKTIHAHCISGVANVNAGCTQRYFLPAKYAISIKEVSEEALSEWSSKKLIATANDLQQYELPYLQEYFLSYHFWFRNQIISYSDITSTSDADQKKVSDKVNRLFNEYYSQIDAAKEKEEKLISIVELCRKLEIIHVFADGNQRTIVFVILNKLLIENGFSPVILENPIVFDGYHSLKELLVDIRVGTENFLAASPPSHENSVLDDEKNQSESQKIGPV